MLLYGSKRIRKQRTSKNTKNSSRRPTKQSAVPCSLSGASRRPAVAPGSETGARDDGRLYSIRGLPLIFSSRKPHEIALKFLPFPLHHTEINHMESKRRLPPGLNAAQILAETSTSPDFTQEDSRPPENTRAHTHVIFRCPRSPGQRKAAISSRMVRADAALFSTASVWNIKAQGLCEHHMLNNAGLL